MFITMHVSFRCTHEYYVQILGGGLQSTISSPWQHFSPLQMQLHHVRFLTISIVVLTGFELQIWSSHIAHHCQEAASEQLFHREMGRLIRYPVFVTALVAICLASSLIVETSSDMVTTGRKLMQVCIQDFVECNTPATSNDKTNCNGWCKNCHASIATGKCQKSYNGTCLSNGMCNCVGNLPC